MRQDHDGARVIVTGGAGGIGLATANRFLMAGARVCLFDLAGDAVTAACENLGSRFGSDRVSGIAGSVCVSSDIERALSTVTAQWGGVDALINAAGVAYAKRTVNLDADDWARVVEVNLTGSFLFARAAARSMLAQGSGAIVNLTSIYGRRGAPGIAAYSASKAGVIGLTRALAVEWASGGVRVNAVAPAYTRTPMIAEILEAGLVEQEKITHRTPQARLIEPEEVAAVCTYLCSDRASAVTGEVIGVDGGWNANGFY